MARVTTFEQAMAVIWDRSGYDRGFISNPFAGDDAARLGLVRTARTLQRLGNPERDYAIVHVAGSKGKGSTCSFIDSMLREFGVSTGRFLSPHLHSFQERFVVDGLPIGEEDFTSLVNDVFEAVLDVESADPAIGQLTAWELSTAMALLWFSRLRCGAAVVEVGMGGTLDATNVVDPAVSVITRLDYEHTAILGTTMAEIAANKAGIIKRGKPVVSADQPGDGLRVIEARAAELDSRLQVANRDWWTEGMSDSFTVESPTWKYANLQSSLIGQHQVANAGLAIAAIHDLAGVSILPFTISERGVRRALASTFLPGRFEVVSHESGATIVIDGAHTPASMRALTNAVRDRFPGAYVTSIVGMLSDKDPGAVLRSLEAITTRWIVSPVQSPRSLAADVIAALLTDRGLAVDSSTSIPTALDLALRATGADHMPQVVVVTGSFASVTEARTLLGLA